MLNNKKIAVVVPAYNEAAQIGIVIESMPDFVDRIVIVNDCSSDDTTKVVLKCIENDTSPRKEIKTFPKLHKSRYNEAELILQKNNEDELKYHVPSQVINKNPDIDRVILINHLKNGGVGASIARGYKWCKDHDIDCTAVMAGDGQMDPDELESICKPIINGEVDYVKGNRLIHRSSWLVMPKIRFLGNSVLSIMTKLASGYWRVSDTQTGYTAISKKALNAIRIHKIYKRYGMPNDLLVKLNIAYCSIKEVEIKPVYYVGEKTKMKICRVIPKISYLLLKLFFKRLWIKYLFRDFHPLFFLYHAAFLIGIIWLPYLLKVLKALVLGKNMSFETLFAFTFLGIMGFQFLLFAMWMDIQDNERLYK